MENSTEIRFGADASAVGPAAAEAAASIEGIQEPVIALEESFAVMGEAALGAFERIVLGASSARTSLMEMGESAAEARKMISEIGEAILAFVAFEAIKKFAENMGEAQEKAEHLSVALGLSNSDIQRMAALANATGMNLDMMARAVTKIDAGLASAHSGSQKASEAFKQLGIDIDVPRTQLELVNSVVDGFANLAPGVDKVQVAYAVFGRNLISVAPLLHLTAEEHARVNEQTEKYGLVSETAHQAGLKLAESFNENKNAMMGVNNVLTEALAPILTVVVKAFNDFTASMIESYTHGGWVKEVLDTIVAVANDIGIVFAEIGRVIGATFGVLVSGANGSHDAFELFRQVAAGLAAALVTVGLIIEETINVIKVLALDFALLALYAQSAADHIADFFTGGHSAAPIDDALKRVNQSIRDIITDSKSAFDNAQKLLDKLNEPPKAQAFTNPDDPSSRSTGAALGKKKPTAEKSMMGDYETQKSDADAKWALEHEGVLRNQQQADKEFWDFLLHNAALSAKDREAVQRKYNEAVIALNRQATAETIEALRAETTSATQQAQAQLAVEKGRIAEEIKTTKDAASHKLISRAEEMARISALVQEQETAERDAAETIYNLRVSLDEGMMAHYAQDTVEYKKLLEDKKAAHLVYESAITKASADAVNQRADLERKAANDSIKQWTATVQPIVSAMGGVAKGLIEGTETMRQAWAKLGDFLLTKALDWAEKQIVIAIATEQTRVAALEAGVVMRTGLETTGNAASIAASAAAAIIKIGHSAAVAAGHAYEVVAGWMPFGPILAPAAAAVALGAVLAIGKSIFSAEGGWGDVSHDGAMTQLHKNEMVLPATIARPMRSLLASWDEGSTLSGMQGNQPGSIPRPSGGSRGGDTINITAMDSRSMEQTLNRNPAMLARVFSRAHSRGNGG
jgi:hypothetical protein